VAEYARNGYQDYVGFHPDLVEGVLAFTPAIPSQWTSFAAVLPFGRGESLGIDFGRAAGEQRWTLRLSGPAAHRMCFTFLNPDKSRSRVEFDLAPGKPVLLQLGAGRALVDGRAVAAIPVQASYAAVIGDLHFVTPKAYRPQAFPVLRGKDVLKGIIEHDQYR
jgi:hypothetical protein